MSEKQWNPIRAPKPTKLINPLRKNKSVNKGMSDFVFVEKIYEIFEEEHPSHSELLGLIKEYKKGFNKD